MNHIFRWILFPYIWWSADFAMSSSALRSFCFTIKIIFSFQFLCFSNWTCVCNCVFFSVFLIYDVRKSFDAVLISIVWLKSILKINIKIRFVILICVIDILTSFQLIHARKRHNWRILILSFKEILRKMLTS